MSITHHPCCSTRSFFKPCPPFTDYRNKFANTTPFANHSKSGSVSFKRLYFSSKLEKFRRAHVRFCAENGVLEEVWDTILPRKRGSEESEELELLNKPSPKIVDSGPVEEVENNGQKKPDRDELLEPFYKFFKEFEEESEPGDIRNETSTEERQKVSVEYYEPKRGDSVVGVVVSGNENKLDVSVGADLLGTMLTKEVLPLYDKEMDHLLWDSDRDTELLVRGKVGIVKNDGALSAEPMLGKPVVELGTVLFAEVLGRTLGGRPLLSTRRLFKRIAWHRVRQIKQLNEPLEIKITEWNTGGLLTRIEGLRAFIPKAELINRVNNYIELKENIGRRIYVQITRINEETNDLILSEKEAWAMMHLQEGTLLEGTVKKIFPYGAQIRIGDTNRSGLLHISNITRGRVNSVSDLLAVDEQVKVLVVKSSFPDKISLSIADLESEPGLFLSNKEKVFSEAKAMAKKYKQKISVFSATRNLESLPTDSIPFGDEERLCANWKWFKFERGDEKDSDM